MSWYRESLGVVISSRLLKMSAHTGCSRIKKAESLITPIFLITRLNCLSQGNITDKTRPRRLRLPMFLAYQKKKLAKHFRNLAARGGGLIIWEKRRKAPLCTMTTRIIPTKFAPQSRVFARRIQKII